MKRLVAIGMLLALSAGCRRAAESKPQIAPKFDEAAWRKNVQEWKEGRAKRLQADNGWLTLVGLYWLSEGPNQLGSDPKTNSVILPSTTPQHGGTLTLKNGVVTLEPAAPMTIDGKAVTGPMQLADDASAKGPTIVAMGPVTFQIIRRGPRLGVRVKDKEADTRVHFRGLDYFPVDPKWRIEAKFEPYATVKKIPITDVTGMTSDFVSPGALVFTVDGKSWRIDPVLEEGETDFFIIFKDQTSRDSTYPAARYLYATPPGPDGKVIVDFNKAYNPPCAFTHFATCPLPPPQNRLPFRIEAGEKRYTESKG